MRYINKLIIFFLPVVLITVAVGCEEDEPATYKKPVIVSLSSDEGFIGDEITITGTGLKDVVSVTFGSVAAGGFSGTSSSDTEITVTVPAGMQEGATQLAVYYKGSSETNLGPSANVPFTVLFAPSITEISPASAKPTKAVKISGAYLQTATAVKFGNISVDFTEEAGILTATVPDLEPGVIDVTVDTKGGPATHEFTVIGKIAEVTSFTPTEAKPNNKVTVTGIFFTGTTAVKIGDKAATSFTVKSDTELEFTIAPGSATGPINITNAYGTGASGDNFNVIQTLPVPYTVYSEALNSNWENWGWNTTTTLESTEQAAAGSKSIKALYTNEYGGFQIHPKTPDPFDISSVTKVKLSIYGGALSGGKQVGLYLKEKGAADGGPKVLLSLVAGQWTTFEVPVSDLGNLANISEFVVQNNGTLNMVIYIDNIILE
jgi:hypothetical protein